MVDEQPRRPDLDAVVWGVTIMTVGAVLMLGHSGPFGWHLLWRLWPIQIVAFGAAAFLRSRRDRRHPEGVWLLFLGIWLLLWQLEIISAAFWPLLLIVAGSSLVYRAIAQPRGSEIKR